MQNLKKVTSFLGKGKVSYKEVLIKWKCEFFGKIRLRHTWENCVAKERTDERTNEQDWIYRPSPINRGSNNTIHSSISMAPSKVQRSDEIYIRQKLYGKEKLVKSYKYQIGDHLRISKSKIQFKKSIFPIGSKRGLSVLNVND